jgi:hypothetical protein
MRGEVTAACCSPGESGFMLTLNIVLSMLSIIPTSEEAELELGPAALILGVLGVLGVFGGLGSFSLGAFFLVSLFFLPLPLTPGSSSTPAGKS